jgi:RimJ/RimL family protein N-acetyltransferase
MAAELESVWPLFALRIRTDRLVLRLPTDDALIRLIALARAGIHEPGEMPFGVAWSTLPSPAFERGAIQHHWSRRADWSPDGWGLNLVVESDGRPIGSQGLYAERFPIARSVHSGSWLGRAFQGRGYGKEMRTAVLALAFDGLGAREATSEAFLDNAASNGVSRSLGYADNGIGSLAPEGVARETQRFRMTVEGWRARARPPVVIEGLDACRELFGADAG